MSRPPNSHWYLLQSEQSHTSVTLRRDLWDFSETHTFYAIVSLGSIEREATSHSDFAELAESSKQSAPYETRLTAYSQSLQTRQSQWCIRFDSTYSVRGAPAAPDRDLTMVVRGYRCRHPSWPKVTLDFFYSERGLPGEIDPDLWEEGQRILDGVRIDIAPDTPAA